MSNDKIPLTPEQAASVLLWKNNLVHTITQAGPCIIGADMEREALVAALNDPSTKPEIAGPAARHIGHGVAMMFDGKPMFLETDEAALKALEANLAAMRESAASTPTPTPSGIDPVALGHGRMLKAATHHADPDRMAEMLERKITEALTAGDGEAAAGLVLAWTAAFSPPDFRPFPPIVANAIKANAAAEAGQL